MDCPACKTPMLVLEVDGVEVDYCQECRGIWLDAGELDLLCCENKSEGELRRLPPVGNIGERRRRCPRCRLRMKKKAYQPDPTAPRTILDECPASHGWWFDEGELRAVIAGAARDRQDRVMRFFSRLLTGEERDGVTERQDI